MFSVEVAFVYLLSSVEVSLHRFLKKGCIEFRTFSGGAKLFLRNRQGVFIISSGGK